MATVPRGGSTNKIVGPGQSGQAILELALVVPILLVLVFGLVDFGRAIYDHEVMVNLSREGSNLASRGTDGTTAVQAVVNAAAPLDLSCAGCGKVIVTEFSRDSDGTLSLSNQWSQGSLAGAVSKIGTDSFPVTDPPIPPPNGSVYVTEVFYAYTPITPIGRLFLPSTTPLYDVAYF